MSKDEIINDLEQQIENLKIELKLKDEIIFLYKSRQIIPQSSFICPVEFKPFIGDVIPNPMETIC